jgi:hypothetical protein
MIPKFSIPSASATQIPTRSPLSPEEKATLLPSGENSALDSIVDETRNGLGSSPALYLRMCVSL